MPVVLQDLSSHIGRCAPQGTSRLNPFGRARRSRAKGLRLVERKSLCELVPCGHRHEPRLGLRSSHAIETVCSNDDFAQASYRPDSPLRRRGTGPAGELRTRLFSPTGGGELAVARSPTAKHSGKLHSNAQCRADRMDTGGVQDSSPEKPSVTQLNLIP